MPSRIERENVSDLSPQCFVEEKNFFCAKRRCACKKEIVGLGRKLSVAEQSSNKNACSCSCKLGGGKEQFFESI